MKTHKTKQDSYQNSDGMLQMKFFLLPQKCRKWGVSEQLVMASIQQIPPLAYSFSPIYFKFYLQGLYDVI